MISLSTQTQDCRLGDFISSGGLSSRQPQKFHHSQASPSSFKLQATHLHLHHRHPLRLPTCTHRCRHSPYHQVHHTTPSLGFSLLQERDRQVTKLTVTSANFPPPLLQPDNICVACSETLRSFLLSIRKYNAQPQSIATHLINAACVHLAHPYNILKDACRSSSFASASSSP